MSNSGAERPIHVKAYLLLSDGGIIAGVSPGSTTDFHLLHLHHMGYLVHFDDTIFNLLFACSLCHLTLS